MKELYARYASVAPEDTDYTELLVATNVFGAGRDLVYDAAACRKLVARLADIEACLDIDAVNRCLRAGVSATAADLESMKLGCDLEEWALFSRPGVRRALYIGSGGYPTSALYALQRHPDLEVDGVDIVAHCTVLAKQVADRLDLGGRLRAFTANALDLEPDLLTGYDAFLLSSATRPKNRVIEHLIAHKRPGAAIYAREDPAHPHFYEPVTVDHPDVISARRARVLWADEHGSAYPQPRGCETEPEHNGPRVSPR